MCAVAGWCGPVHEITIEFARVYRTLSMTVAARVDGALPVAMAAARPTFLLQVRSEGSLLH